MVCGTALFPDTEMELERVGECPVCGGSDLSQPDAESCIVRCRACGFVFDSPRPTLASIVAHYSRPGKYDVWLGATRGRELLWRRRLRKVLKVCRPGSLLDVGAGIGHFLGLARPNFSRVLGTEISASGIEVARAKFGVELLHGELQSLALPPESFDNITMFHVLEHVQAPVALLRRCRTLLRPGGAIILAVPNDVHSWTCRVRAMGKAAGVGRFAPFSRKLGITPAFRSDEIHLSHFTQKTLSRALETAGFAGISTGWDPYYAATGMYLALHTLHYWAHSIARLAGVDAYQALWAVAYKP
jgi:ubiquinone/menaquinone biosynthesis C-methylase UbiE